MAASKQSYSLRLRRVEKGPVTNGIEAVTLQTDQGTVSCRFHPAESGAAAVLWVGGAGGGLDGPAGGLYPRLAEQLLGDGIASLRLDYRHPGELASCVMDTLLGTAYLGTLGWTRVLLVGHSFGGAVVITAAGASTAVIGVAALSSQTFGTGTVAELSPRPLLLMHGTADEVLPPTCSRDLYKRAREPKQLRLYRGCGHGLDECREQIDRDLLRWLRAAARRGASHEATENRVNSPRDEL
jgi:fermentation-respiration switch protein FrsA (DUF1100 family)